MAEHQTSTAIRPNTTYGRRPGDGGGWNCRMGCVGWFHHEGAAAAFGGSGCGWGAFRPGGFGPGAAGRWADQLIDFGPRNTLLYFKERQTTTLDLAEAAAGGVADLIRGQKVRLRTLVPDPDRHNTACNTAHSLRRKLVELEEEQGIQAGWVARGLLCMVGSYTRGSVSMQPAGSADPAAAGSGQPDGDRERLHAGALRQTRLWPPLATRLPRVT